MAVLASACAGHGTAPCTPPAAPAQYPSTYVRPPAPPVLIRNATILTAAGPELQHASILFAEGKVVSVGSDSEAAPADAFLYIASVLVTMLAAMALIATLAYRRATA